MFGIELFERWRAGVRRRRMIRRELDAFARINPELHADIGLFPHSFRDEAERVVDCRLRDQSAGHGACMGRPTTAQSWLKAMAS
jgi:hypothetical protein